ncbi:uncharacterized protein LOC122282297 [Carya illinoinensis]|uniref:uncharacterized protein LOC122282297 n=1 Tax=Carya illinoinensis TaxID=32201 RepID=UPI001C7231D6|nr:uncharacterized protein LOC122282297 [Carya illinoinensis]
MSILVWNCRGLGNPRTVGVLRQLAKDKIPSLVFLVETKCNSRRMDMIRRKLRFDYCLAVDSVGLRGGVALLWKTDWNVEIISYSRWHISAIVLEEENGPAWQFTGFYGHPEFLNCTRNKRGLIFRYEASWDLRDECQGIVTEAWGKGQHGSNGASSMRHKLRANQRRKTNTIKAIKDQLGREITEQQAIGGVFTEPKVNEEMESRLMEPFTPEEVTNAVFQMNPLGSPGPDGFPAQFYQQHWQVVGKGVCDFALKALNQEASLQEVNDTYITLIPKSAFIPRRLISDNTLIAYEVLHSMTSRVKGRRGFMALKLDMSKAYDRVEWDFVTAVLVKMGFPQHWINLVQNCLKSVSYSIIVNGEPQQQFVPTRGIRQGDPLSPYIFIICAEALTALLNRAELCKDITSIPLGRGPITVNHLFFADDSLLFCQANKKELYKVISILVLYEKASGQMLNKEKSSIFFSKNTRKEAQHQILMMAGVKSKGSFEKYLGLPAIVGRTKVAAFHSLIDRTWARIASWKTKYLSAAGKETLLKAVLQAIPTYSMGIFLLPVSITKKLNQLLRKFWWGYNEDTTKIQWVNWKQISYSKESGGLGFRDFRSFNLAMLSKQGWRILQNPSSLVSMILKQKYFRQTDLMGSTLGRSPSFAWRGIHAGLSLLRKGLLWRVGNGHSINIWSNCWIPSLPEYQVKSTQVPNYNYQTVSDLLEPHQLRWREPLLQQLFSEEEVEAIKAIPISVSGRKDVRAWRLTSNGSGKTKYCRIGRGGSYTQRDLDQKKWILQGKGFKHPSILVQQARTDLLDYKGSTTNPKSTLNQATTVVHRWSKPSLGQFKANWDAAVRRGEGMVGIGVIIRDHQGLVIGTLQASRQVRGNHLMQRPMDYCWL